MTFPVKLTIPSDSKFLCLVRSALKDFLVCQNVPEKTICKLVLCVDEACSNVIKYSYKGKNGYPIEISFDYEDHNFVVKIRDYGNPCDVSKIKPRPLREIRRGGLGTHFMFQIMDSVDYCTNLEKGTLLTMSKKLDKELNTISREGGKNITNEC